MLLELDLPELCFEIWGVDVMLELLIAAADGRDWPKLLVCFI